MSKDKSHQLTTLGGCQCGALRYRISGPLGEAVICHCRMCQKAFGNWGAALVSVPVTAVQWTRGTPSLFRSSAIVARGFCNRCGTPMFMQEDGDENIDLAIGTLDNPNAAVPIRQSGIESRLSWFASLATLPEETTADYRSAEDLEKLKSLQQPDGG
jgi:hypothetical protein